MDDNIISFANIERTCTYFIYTLQFLFDLKRDIKILDFQIL